MAREHDIGRVLANAKLALTLISPIYFLHLQQCNDLHVLPDMILAIWHAERYRETDSITSHSHMQHASW